MIDRSNLLEILSKYQPGDLVPELSGEPIEYANEYGPDLGAIAIVAVIVIIALGTTISDLLENTLFEPWTELIALFTGRPREQATAQIVQWLGTQNNPAAKLWSTVLGRLLKDYDIVISSSSAGSQQLLGQARANFVDSLIAQGQTKARAQQIADIAMSEAAQNQSAVIDEFKTPPPAGLTLVGPQSLATYYNKWLSNNGRLSIQGSNQYASALKATLYNGPLSALLNAQVNFPPPPVLPALNGQCTTGYQYDAASDSCLLTPISPDNNGNCALPYVYNNATFLCELPAPTPSQPGPGPILTPTPTPIQPVGPVLPQPTPGTGDELTDCCQSSAASLAAIASAINTLAGAAPQGDGGACCAQIVQTLTAMQTAILSLPGAFSASVQPPAISIDTTAFAAAIGTLQTTLAQIDADNNTNAGNLTAAVSSIANAIASAPAPDLTALTKATQQNADQGDIQQSTLDDLIAKGYIAPDDAQFYQGLPWADGFFHKEATKYRDLIRGMVMGGVGVDPTTGKTGLPDSFDFESGLKSIITKWLSGNDAIVRPLLAPLISAVQAQLKPAGATSLGNIGVNPDTPVQTSFGVAINATIASALLSYFGLDIGESVTHIAELISAGVGFEGLRDVTLGPLIHNGIAKVADMQAKSLFRQDGPGLGTLMSMAARTYVDPTRVAALAPLYGMPDEFVAPLQRNAYTSLPERFLIQLFDSQLFTQADLNRILTEHGINAADRTLMVNALPYVATRPQRNQLQATIESAYAAGLLSDQDLINQLETLQGTTDYQTLILSRVRWEMLMRTTKELESSYLPMVQSGAVSVAQYQAQLTGIGLQPTAVNALVAAAENRLAATSFRQAAAAERALERATASVERRAAVTNFASGQIDAAALSLALIATGLSAAQAAAWTDLAILRQGGAARLTYGKLLQPAAAQLLRERVTALTAQRRKNLIDNALYTSQLQNLGIPQNWINALLAAADAGIDVVGAPAFVNVSTS